MGEGSIGKSRSFEVEIEQVHAQRKAKAHGLAPDYISPKAILSQLWLALVAVSVICGVISDTFLWSFDSRIITCWSVSYIGDAIYMLMMFTRFLTAFYKDGILITDGKMIRKHYLKTTFALDLFTCMPLELWAFMPGLPDGAPNQLVQLKYVAIFRCNRLLRLYYVFSHFDTLESRLGTNVKRLLTTKYLTIAGLVVHIMACGWYAYGCPGKHDGMDMDCYPNSWATSFNFYGQDSLNGTSTVRSYVLSLYWAVTTATSTGYGEIHPVTLGEKWYAIISMMMGITVFFGVILGGLASQLTNLDIQRARYTHRMAVIHRHLADNMVPSEMQDQVTGYYEYLWHRKKGVTGDGLMNALPITFHAEVAKEANKHILDKAPMFKHLSPGFLRMLSLELKPSLYLPKQIICDHNDITHCMYYVQRGELEILSASDHKSPLMTMRCGSLFGELSLVATTPRSNNIQAAAHCDLMKLEKTDLNNVLAHYPGVIQRLQTTADERLEVARQLEAKQKEETPEEEQQDVVIQMDMDEGSESGDIEARPTGANSDHMVPVHRPSVMSRLGRGTQRLGRTIRQTVSQSWRDLREWDWIFMPNSTFIRFWEYLMLAVTLVIAVVYPYAASFIANLGEITNHGDEMMWFLKFTNSNKPDQQTTETIYTIMFTMDVLVFLDVIIRVRTAHVTPNGTYKDFKSIKENYIFTWGFVFDILTTLPLQIFALCFPHGPIRTSCVYLLSLNRLIRVWRIEQFFSKKEKDLSVNIGTLRFFKFVAYIILFTHWSACIWYLGYNVEGRYILESAEELTTTAHQYLISLYWAAATMTSTGYGDITPDSTIGYMIAIFTEIGGLLVFGAILALTAATLTNNDAPRVGFLEKMSAVKIFMKGHNLGTEIQERVINAMNLDFQKHQGVHTPGSDERLMHDMPCQLQQDIAYHETKDLLGKIPLFKECDEAFLRRLALKTHSFQYSPGDHIITRGDNGHEMYFVRKGCCEVVTKDYLHNITRIGPGHYFGEIGLIFGEQRTVTVVAASYCELLMLKREDLDEVLKDFPLVARHITEVSENKEYLAKLKDTVNVQQEARDDTNIHIMRGFNDEKEPNLMEFWTEAHGLDHEYVEAIDRLGFFPRMMSKLLMNRSILPQGFNAQFWEGCRVMISMAMVLCVLLQASLCHMSPHLWLICYVMDAMCFVDLYLKFHYAYYNKDNVLVTHPLATAKNYFKTSFFLDLLACFPTEFIAYAVLRSFAPEAIHIYAVVRANRLLQFYRVPLAFNVLECNVKYDTGVVKEVKFFFYLFLFFHTLTCIWFFQACPPVGMNMHWAVPLESQGLFQAGDHVCANGTWVDNIAGMDTMTIGEKYFESFYWAAATGAVVGYGDITATKDNTAELLISIFSMIMGIVFFGYIIASVAASMANADAQRARFQNRLVGMNVYLTEQNVSKDLCERNNKYQKYIWLRTQGVDPDTLFEGLTLSLNADVAVALYKDMIDHVPLFKGTGDSFQKMLAMCITPVYYMDNEYIVRKFDTGDNMFFIHRGAVDVVSEDGKMVFDTMKAGRFFGEISLIMSCPRTASIRANGNCDMFILKKTDLDQVLKVYPVIKEQIYKVAEERFSAVRQRSQAKLAQANKGSGAIPKVAPASAPSTSTVQTQSTTTADVTSKVSGPVNNNSVLTPMEGLSKLPALPVKQNLTGLPAVEEPSMIAVETPRVRKSKTPLETPVQPRMVSPVPALAPVEQPPRVPSKDHTVIMMENEIVSDSEVPPVGAEVQVISVAPIAASSSSNIEPMTSEPLPSASEPEEPSDDIKWTRVPHDDTYKPEERIKDNLNNSALKKVSVTSVESLPAQIPAHFFVKVITKNLPIVSTPDVLEATKQVSNGIPIPPPFSEEFGAQIRHNAYADSVIEKRMKALEKEEEEERVRVMEERASCMRAMAARVRAIEVEVEASRVRAIEEEASRVRAIEEQLHKNNNALTEISYNNNAKDDKDPEKGDVAEVEAEPAVPLHRRLLARNRFVIPPNSFFLRILCDITCLLAFLTSLTVIFQCAFQYESHYITAFSYLCEFIFIFEIYVKFHVTRYDEYVELETDFGKVYNVYLRNPGGFAIDLIATIPFEIFAPCFQGSEFTAYSCFRLTRLIRLLRVNQFFGKWEKELDIDMLKVKLTKMLFVIFMMIHICASVWYIIACPFGQCKEGSWAEVEGYLDDTKIVTIFERFTDSIYWCVATLTSTGYGDMTAHSTQEKVFASLTMILGQLLVGSVLGNIASTLANRDTARVDFERQLQNLKSDMNDSKLSKSLISRVVDHFDYAWTRNKGIQQHDLFRDSPFCFQTELFMNVYGTHLRDLPLFAEASDAFLRAISLRLHQTIVQPGNDIVKQGDVGNEMYIIHKGEVEICFEDSDEAEWQVSEGAFIDEINLLYDIPRSRTVKALIHVDALTLTMTDLEEVLKDFPQDSEKIRFLGEKHYGEIARKHI